MDKDTLARLCVNEMIKQDTCTQKMNMNIVAVSYDRVTVEMVVADDMLNGFGACHGGQIFTLADSAFAFACNVHNEITVAAGADITFVSAAYAGDVLTARSKRISRLGRLGVYDVKIVNQNDRLIAQFRGRSYARKGKKIVSIPKDTE